MRTIWTSGLLALALLAGLTGYLAPLEPGVVALQFAFTPTAFGEIISLWSAEDLLRYRRHLLLDFLLLAAYGSFGYFLATRTGVFGSSSASLRRVAAWFLPLAALFDATENVLHGWLTEVPRVDAVFIHAASAGFSCLKWLLIAGFFLLLAHAGLRKNRH